MTTSKDSDTPPEGTPVGTPSGTPTGDRIAKLLARAGIASRREIERMIEEGRVALNGTIVDTPATILRNLNGVTVDGDPVQPPEHARLFLYHKPPGLLVTERDPAGRPIIYDKLPKDLPRLVPVGRLDMNTEGLLLMTTDGGLKRTLELPASGVERAYRARAYGPITQAQLDELMEGVEIEGVRYGAINANIERRTGANVWIEMILTEGKNREVRRVLEYLGLQVSRLIRTRYGPFVLGELMPGQIGEVTQHDVVAFQKDLGKGKPAGPAERPNIGISASAGAGAGIGGRPNKPAALPVAGPIRTHRPVTERPARVKPERIRPTALQQRGDTTNPWARPEPGERTAARLPAQHSARPTGQRRDDDRDRGEALSTSPKIKHFRPAKPPRNAPPAPTRVGGSGPRRTDAQRTPYDASRPQRTRDDTARPQRTRDDAAPRTPIDKRAARSAGGRPGAEPRTFRPDTGGKPARPAGKGPSGGRGHPPRAPRGGKK
ncbi:pseudouridine synthase [Sphingomonas ginsenosidivorax]|uniref:Pseudouridine synthase n=1 Tax=Sphingomonas ginsenosidivorax TaxID=862135 RepID=A0A5C6UG49_9SPHN|nr:pseudouridine synthase [Sphingomonas ginsenosidivorax]TXC71015.1 pseudouridine synthase [Sphingomonas ginsenosidivorax]